MRQYQSSIVLVLLLLLLGASPTILLVASAQRPVAASGPILSQERITLTAPNAQPVTLTVDVVDTALQPNTARLPGNVPPENGGLLWLYPQITDRPLEARDYPSPVSVALFDRNGAILQMLDIDPCDIRCPSYFPKVAYRGRLEVAKGWFARQGIEVGSQIEATFIQIMGSGQN